MRYPLAGRETLSNLTQGGGFFAITAGLLKGFGKRALGPLAIPVAIGSGLVWMGRSMGDSFVELSTGELRVKLGMLFDERIPMSDVRSVKRQDWGWLRGLGVRTNLKDMVAVVTRTGSAAEITFWKPVRLPVIPRLVHVNAQRLVVSPEHTEEFIRDLESRLAAR